MRLDYGIYQDEFYAPLWMFGFIKDINYDGSHMWAFVCFKWYFGVLFLSNK